LAQKPPYEVLDEVLALGDAAMCEARKAGRNQIHYVRSVALTVFVGADNRDWVETDQPA
jgi:hypothetical protein